MAAAIPIAGLALGGLGLLQQSQQAKKQQDLQEKAIKAGKFTQAAQGEQFKLAQGYENGGQAKEDATAISSANTNAVAQLKQQLEALNADFGNAGGSPTGDTAFNISAANTANRTLDPLKNFQAQLAATETERKMAAFNPVLNAPTGQIAQNYFTAAANNAPNYGPSLSLFSQALKNLSPAPGSGVGSAIGSGAIDPNTIGNGGNVFFDQPPAASGDWAWLGNNDNWMAA